MTTFLEAPWVVGTTKPDGLAALASRPRDAHAPDLIEARIDLGADLAPDASVAQMAERLRICRELESAGRPVLFTGRLVQDGGRWTDDLGRRHWFEEASRAVSWLDIEIESPMAQEIVDMGHARGSRVIVSHHDFSGTRSISELSAIAEKARALGADVVKVATMIKSTDDHATLIDLVHHHNLPTQPLAIVGMGPWGTALRSYLPVLGSRLTYGYLDQVSAPGQLHAHELVARLIQDCPTYAAFRETSRPRNGRAP